MVQVGQNRGGRSRPVESEVREDDPIAQAEEAVTNAEAALASSAADDPNRFRLLDSLACAIDDRHNMLGINDAGRLPEAVEYAKEALGLVAEDYVHDNYEPDGLYRDVEWGRIFKNRGTVCNTLQTIHLDLYRSTREAQYLDQGICYGDEAVEHTRKYQDQYPQWLWEHIYGRRTQILGSLYRARFNYASPEIGGSAQDLNYALLMYGRSADYTPTVPESYYRFCTWCNLMVVKAGVRNDVKLIDAALMHRNSRRRKLINPSAEDIRFSCRNNYFEYSRLLARRWQMTGADEDFQLMIDESREFIEYDRSLENPRAYIGDAANDHDVLRACALWMAEIVLDEENEWADHLPSVETALALLMKLLEMTPLVVEEDFFRRDHPVVQATFLTRRRWQITGDPVHGFALDDINVHCAGHNTAISANSSARLGVLDGVSQQCSYGTSVAMNKEFTTFDPLTSRIGQPRLMFLLPVSAETWIRKRNDDGTVELGATEADADVWKFLQNYDKPKVESTPEKTDKEAQNDHAEAGVTGGDAQVGDDSSLAGAGQESQDPSDFERISAELLLGSIPQHLRQDLNRRLSPR